MSNKLFDILPKNSNVNEGLDFVWTPFERSRTVLSYEHILYM